MRGVSVGTKLQSLMKMSPGGSFCHTACPKERHVIIGTDSDLSLVVSSRSGISCRYMTGAWFPRGFRFLLNLEPRSGEVPGAIGPAARPAERRGGSLRGVDGLTGPAVGPEGVPYAAHGGGHLQAVPEASALLSDATGLKELEMAPSFLMLFWQDELRLRADFLLVTCFRGNDYLPQLMPLGGEAGRNRVTRCDVDSADLWPRYLTWRQKSSPGAGLDAWPSCLLPWT